MPRSDVVGINSDYQSAVDLVGPDGDAVASMSFSDGLTMQFVSAIPGPPGHYSALGQMQNALAALGFPL